MEEDQNIQTEKMQEQEESKEQTPFSQSSNEVSFPTVGQPQKTSGPKTILIIGILILVAVLGFVVYKSATGKSGATPVPTSFENQIEGSQTSDNTVPSATTTPTPIPADKTKVAIVVENGTGITGEAAYLQTQLKNLGYTNVKVANATTQSATTTSVTFSKTLGSDVVTEITQELNSIYQKVTTTTSSSGSSDVLVITGLRKGATAKPSATPTPKATTSPSSSPTASPTPTATPTP